MGFRQKILLSLNRFYKKLLQFDNNKNKNNDEIQLATNQSRDTKFNIYSCSSTSSSKRSATVLVQVEEELLPLSSSVCQQKCN